MPPAGAMEAACGCGRAPPPAQRWACRTWPARPGTRRSARPRGASVSRRCLHHSAQIQFQISFFTLLFSSFETSFRRVLVKKSSLTQGTLTSQFQSNNAIQKYVLLSRLIATGASAPSLLMKSHHNLLQSNQMDGQRQIGGLSHKAIRDGKGLLVQQEIRTRYERSIWVVLKIAKRKNLMDDQWGPLVFGAYEFSNVYVLHVKFLQNPMVWNTESLHESHTNLS